MESGQGKCPCYGKDMSKVTSKLQVTLPKALANRYGISPGDEIQWIAAGEVIKVLPTQSPAQVADSESRLRVFEQATVRQQERQKGRRSEPQVTDRGWTREDLYDERGSH
jgi:bifunctional DNA-binding transcriptional regulator/antitoxin component of YhaV-PrlF toxin-antitoxin module